MSGPTVKRTPASDAMRKILESDVAKMNAVAVVERMRMMERKINAVNERINQQDKRIAQLLKRIEVESMMKTHIETHGSGPTA